METVFHFHVPWLGICLMSDLLFPNIEVASLVNRASFMATQRRLVILSTLHSRAKTLSLLCRAIACPDQCTKCVENDPETLHY